MQKAINATIYFLIAAALITRAPIIYENFRKEGTLVEPTKSYLLDEKNNLVPIIFPATNKKSVAIFWASWCAPCKLELGRIQSAIEKKEISGDNLFAISIDANLDDAIKAKVDRKYSFKILYDKDLNLSQKFGVTSTPTLAIINEKNQIDWQSTGISPTLINRLKN